MHTVFSDEICMVINYVCDSYRNRCITRGIIMIKSMTGFGRCEIANEKRKFTIEMKSVNHRYFDVNIKMPKKLNFFESSIRNLLKEYIPSE